MYEREWWGDCTNTFAEETKQLTYAHRMGIDNSPADGKWPRFDLGGRSVIDIGGGPTSMLLRTANGGRRLVIDPCEYPDWVRARYDHAGIEYEVVAAEDYRVPAKAADKFDEAWIYNCLQHTMSPEKIVAKARRSARLIRIFEWVNIPPHQGHPHELKPDLLNEWLHGTGTVEDMGAPPNNARNGCNAVAFYGEFPTG